MLTPQQWAEKLHADVSDRAGLGFDEIDDKTEKEMLAAWARLFETCANSAYNSALEGARLKLMELSEEHMSDEFEVAETFEAAAEAVSSMKEKK